MEDIEHYDIPIYNFPYDVEEDDEETIQDNSELRVCVSKDGYSWIDASRRPFYHLLLLVRRKLLTWTDILFERGDILGVLPRSTTQSTRTLAGSGVPF